VRTTTLTSGTGGQAEQRGCPRTGSGLRQRPPLSYWKCEATAREAAARGRGDPGGLEACFRGSGWPGVAGRRKDRHRGRFSAILVPAANCRMRPNIPVLRASSLCPGGALPSGGYDKFCLMRDSARLPFFRRGVTRHNHNPIVYLEGDTWCGRGTASRRRS
jgi:hypothetical protein